MYDLHHVCTNTPHAPQMVQQSNHVLMSLRAAISKPDKTVAILFHEKTLPGFHTFGVQTGAPLSESTPVLQALVGQ